MGDENADGRTCLAVGKDGDVVPLQEGLEHGSRGLLVQPLLGHIRREAVVVGEVALPHTCPQDDSGSVVRWKKEHNYMKTALVLRRAVSDDGNGRFLRSACNFSLSGGF